MGGVFIMPTQWLSRAVPTKVLTMKNIMCTILFTLVIFCHHVSSQSFDYSDFYDNLAEFESVTGLTRYLGVTACKGDKSPVYCTCKNGKTITEDWFIKRGYGSYTIQQLLSAEYSPCSPSKISTCTCPDNTQFNLIEEFEKVWGQGSYDY